MIHSTSAHICTQIQPFFQNKNQYSQSYSMKTNSSESTKSNTQSSEQPTLLRKDRNYFKPEQFIWNNPFRSSTRIYQYYHAANDRYQQTQAVKIRQLQKEDKENMEKQRIQRVIQLRAKSRDLLKQRQSARELLEQSTQRTHHSFERKFKSTVTLGSSPSKTANCSSDQTTTKTLKTLKSLGQMNIIKNQLPQIAGSHELHLKPLSTTSAHLQKKGSKLRSFRQTKLKQN